MTETRTLKDYAQHDEECDTRRCAKCQGWQPRQISHDDCDCGPAYTKNGPCTCGLDALLAQPPAQGGWQPMETAPKDGTSILTFSPNRLPEQVVIRRWQGQPWGCTCCPSSRPTHWMLLPALPTQDKETR